MRERWNEAVMLKFKIGSSGDKFSKCVLVSAQTHPMDQSMDQGQRTYHLSQGLVTTLPSRVTEHNSACPHPSWRVIDKTRDK